MADPEFDEEALSPETRRRLAELEPKPCTSVPCPWDVAEPDSAEPYVPHPSFRAAAERYAARMRDAGLEVTVTVHSPGHVTISGRDPQAEGRG